MVLLELRVKKYQYKFKIVTHRKKHWKTMQYQMSLFWMYPSHFWIIFCNL